MLARKKHRITAENSNLVLQKASTINIWNKTPGFTHALALSAGKKLLTPAVGSQLWVCTGQPSAVTGSLAAIARLSSAPTKPGRSQLAAGFPPQTWLAAGGGAEGGRCCVWLRIIGVCFVCLFRAFMFLLLIRTPKWPAVCGRVLVLKQVCPCPCQLYHIQTASLTLHSVFIGPSVHIKKATNAVLSRGMGVCHSHEPMHSLARTLVLTRAKFWFKGQKRGNTGLPCLVKPMLAHSMYHGTHIADITRPYPSKHDNGVFLFMCTPQVPLSCLHSN